MIGTLYRARNRRRDRILRKCAAMRAAKERIRMERADSVASWPIVRILTVLDPATGAAHRWVLRAGGECGRQVALEVDGRATRIGSERTMRARLARAMWRAAMIRNTLFVGGSTGSACRRLRTRSGPATRRMRRQEASCRTCKTGTEGKR